MPPDLPKGIIQVWSGAKADIPIMWHLCDGQRGTPDLRNYFVPGAGATYNPADTAGALSHVHTATANGHSHTIAGGTVLVTPPGGINTETTNNPITFTTDQTSTLAPYYALCYIMYLKARR